VLHPWLYFMLLPDSAALANAASLLTLPRIAVSPTTTTTTITTTLYVQAEGWEHSVTPVKRGSRLILKMAFTSTRIKLPAFDANLHREAYAAY
jgi:hypothetical protein